MEWWKLGATVLSLLAPLGIAALTLRNSARNNLELKAAEIVLNSRSPGAARAKAETLKKIFPKQLAKLDPEESSKGMPGFSYEQRLEVFKAMVEHLGKEKEIAQLWVALLSNQNEQLAKDLKMSPFA